MSVEHIVSFPADIGNNILLYYRLPGTDPYELAKLEDWLFEHCRDPWDVDEQVQLSVMPDGSPGFIAVYQLSQRDAVMCRLVW